MEGQEAAVTVIHCPSMVSSELYPTGALCSKCIPAFAVQNIGLPAEHPSGAPLDNPIPLAHFQKQQNGPSTSCIPMIRLQEQKFTSANSSNPMFYWQNRNTVSASDPAHAVNYQIQSPGLGSCSKQKWNCEDTRPVSTVVRLVAPEKGSRTEIVLQMDNVLMDGKNFSRSPPDGAEQNVSIKNELNSAQEPSVKPEYTLRQWILIGLSWIIAVNGLILFLVFLTLSLSGNSNTLMSNLGSTFITVNGITSLLGAIYFVVRIRKHLS